MGYNIENGDKKYLSTDIPSEKAVQTFQASDGLVVWTLLHYISTNVYRNSFYIWDKNSDETILIGGYDVSTNLSAYGYLSDGMIVWREDEGNTTRYYIWDIETRENIYLFSYSPKSERISLWMNKGVVKLGRYNDINGYDGIRIYMWDINNKFWSYLGQTENDSSYYFYKSTATDTLFVFGLFDGNMRSCFVWDREENNKLLLGRERIIWYPYVNNDLITWTEIDSDYNYHTYLWERANKVKINFATSFDAVKNCNEILIWKEYIGDKINLLLLIYEHASPVVNINAQDSLGEPVNIGEYIAIDSLKLIASADDISDTDGIPVGVDNSSWYWWLERDEENKKQGNETDLISISGETTVYFSVKDKLGNEAIASTTIRIDNLEPNINIDSSTVPTNHVNETVSIKINPTDEHSGIDINNDNVKCRVTNILDGAYTNYDLDIAYNPDNVIAEIQWEGMNIVEFTVFDRVGNVKTESVTVNIDKTRPIFTINRSPNQEWDVDSITLTVESMEDEGGADILPATYRYWTTGAEEKQGTEQEITIDTEGETLVYFSVKDSAGNVALEAEEPLTVGIDRQKPTVTLTDIPWTSQDVTVTAQADDQIGFSGIDPESYSATKFHKDTGTGPPILGQPEVSVSLEGITTVTFTVKDRAGNESVPVSCLVHIDKRPPVVAKPTGLLNVGIKDWTNSNTLEAGVQAETGDVAGIDETSWQWSHNGIAWHNEKEANVGAEGESLIYFRVKDHAGNTSSEAGTGFTINVDRTGPTITITQQGNIVTAAASDGASGVGLPTTQVWQWRQGTGEWQSGNVAALTGSGPQTVTFRVSDKLGNQSDDTACTFSVMIDSVPPTITPSIFTSGVFPETWTGLREVQVTAVLYDADSGINDTSRQVSFDGGANFNTWYGTPVTVTATEDYAQKITVVFRAADLAGNTATENIDLWLDAQDPTVTPQILTSGVTPGEWTNQTVTVGVSGSDGVGSGLNESTWQYSIDGGGWLNGTQAAVSAEGVRTIQFRVADNVGNVSVSSIKIYIDTSGPVIVGEVAPVCTEVGNELEVTALAASDNLSNLNGLTWAYAFDDELSFLNLPFTPGTGGVLDTSGLADGMHMLRVEVYDNVGNRGYSSFEFSVDRSGPEIIQIVVSDSLRIVNQDAYTQFGNVQIEVDTIDENPDGSQGEVSSLQYMGSYAILLELYIIHTI